MSYLRHKWQDDALCLDEDVNLFFDKYEEDEDGDIRHKVDEGCRSCPVMRTCFAYAKYYEQTGVWGGVYMTGGEMDIPMNDHKSPEDWAQTYAALTR